MYKRNISVLWYKMLCMLTCLLFLFIFNSTIVWAADIPVFFAGEEIASAKARQGVTYLPLRVVFEQCGTTVDWQEQSKTITATRADGAVLTIITRSNRASLKHNGNTIDLVMPNSVYSENGKIYVPLRFVAENMLCQVDWREGAVYIEPRFWLGNGIDQVPLWQSTDKDKSGGIRYFLNYSDSNLYEFNIKQSAAHRLCTLPLADYQLDRSDRYILNLWIERTSNNNYLINTEIYDRNTGLSANGYDFLYAWVSAADLSKHIIVSGEAPPQQAGNMVYLAGNDGLFAVNELTGEIQNIPTTALFGCNNLVWANERYVLLKNYRGANWVLADMLNGKIKDLTDVLLSEDNKKQLMSIAEIPLESLDDYWQNLGRLDLIEPYPYLAFVQEEQELLHFRLTAAYSWDTNGNYKFIDVVYKID